MKIKIAAIYGIWIIYDNMVSCGITFVDSILGAFVVLAGKIIIQLQWLEGPKMKKGKAAKDMPS